MHLEIIWISFDDRRGATEYILLMGGQRCPIIKAFPRSRKGGGRGSSNELAARRGTSAKQRTIF